MRLSDLPHIRELHLFKSMREDNFAALIQAAYLQTFPQQVQLIAERDCADFLFVVIIPTDGSDLAARGVNHGLALAKALGAKVFVLTVTEPWSRVGLGELSSETGGLNAVAEYAAALEKQAREVLSAVERQATEQGLEVQLLLLRDRHVAEGILAAIEEHDINLVVMSSHGRRGMAKILLGSQTFEVITHGKIPVLVIR